MHECNAYTTTSTPNNPLLPPMYSINKFIRKDFAGAIAASHSLRCSNATASGEGCAAAAVVAPAVAAAAAAVAAADDDEDGDTHEEFKPPPAEAPPTD